VPQRFNGSLSEKNDALYVGDFRPEGSTEEPEHRFLLDVYPVSGRALVLGIAEDGGDCDATIHLEDLMERITWAEYHLQYQERNVEARRQRKAAPSDQASSAARPTSI
jgi:hypothetical protein